MESWKTLSGVQHPSEEDKHFEYSLAQISMMLKIGATQSPTEHQEDLAHKMICCIFHLPILSLLLT